jgi:uncharacterized protein (TIGR03083 family)
MHEAIEAVAADRAALLDICAGLSGEQWQAPSGCPGWSVKDLITHLGNLFVYLVDSSQLPDIDGLSFEKAQDAMVQARRGLEPAAALADYEKFSSLGLRPLADLARLDLEVPVGDGGSYPAAMIPYAFAFDHYLHIRADLFAPRGPLTGDQPPSDELRVSAALTWIEAALPQQNPAAVPVCSLELEITGAGGRTISFGSGEAKARIESSGPAFARWVSQRGSWPELGVQASGDEQALAAARALKVY